VAPKPLNRFTGNLACLIKSAVRPHVQNTVARAVARSLSLGAGAHGERGARAYNGGLGRSPQRGPGAETLVEGQGAKPP